MVTRCTIETSRLILRPFQLSDASEVRRLAGEREIAENTLSIPHPYEEGMAKEWIATHEEGFRNGTLANFAVTRRDNGVLVGAIGLTIFPEHQRAELGYWIGLPYWRNGYATEAATDVIRYGFVELGLNRIYAYHFVRNPASGRVLRKVGMQREGCLRKHVHKWGVFEDLAVCGLVRADYAQ